MARDDFAPFKGNDRLPAPDSTHSYTVEELREFVKCQKDPIYFINNYVKIIALDTGLTQFTLWPFQEKMVRCYHTNRFSITMASRQVGKSTTVVAFFLWYILFNTNVRCCISANKQKIAIDLLQRLKLAYEHLPRFLQQGISAWAKMEVVLANGSSVFAAATSSSAVRGGSYSCVSGTSTITVRLDQDVFTLPIEDWHTAIANSSKHTKSINTDDVFLEGVDFNVLRQQVYAMVLSVDGQTSQKSCGVHRKIYSKSSSYNSAVFGRAQRRRTGVADNTGTSLGTSAVTSHDGQLETSAVAFVCPYENARRSSRSYGQDDRPTTTNMCGTIIGTTAAAHDRAGGDRNHTTTAVGCQSWESDVQRNKRKTSPEGYGSVQRDSTQPRILSRRIRGFEGPQKDTGMDRQNQSQSRKNCQDCGETPRYDANTRTAGPHGTQKRVSGMEQGNHNDSHPTRENGAKKRQHSVEQRQKSNNATRCAVLTNRGFKAFDGIRRTRNRSTLTVRLSNGLTLECTPDHMVYVNETEKVEAKDLRGHSVYTQLGLVEVVDIVDAASQDVYDVLNVTDTHNFFANGILVSNCLLLDEFAFVPENIANEFYASTFPTITSGKSTKIIMVSTPNGMNLFHKFWSESQSGDNDFVATVAHWSDVPGRDEAWKQETIRNIGGPEKFAQEMDLSFLSTSYTLIRPQVLQTLTHRQPVATTDTGYAEFVAPDPARSYVMTVDTASGQGLDYSAFVIVDVTEMPYRVVATYANNRITTMEFPQVIVEYARRYFKPWLLVEVMDIGRDVAFILSRDHEYERLMTAVTEKRLGQRLTFNAKMNRHLGLRMTAGVKRSGCAVLKTLVENHHLLLHDHRLIQQLSVFVQRGSLYMAEVGHHDDLVMPLVMLGWASLQPNFAEITNTRALDTYTQLVAESKDNPIPIVIDDDQPTPLGILGSGEEDDDPYWMLR